MAYTSTRTYLQQLLPAHFVCRCERIPADVFYVMRACPGTYLRFPRGYAVLNTPTPTHQV